MQKHFVLNDPLQGQIKEYSISFKEGDSSLENLLDFLQQDYVYRVNINVVHGFNINTFSIANKLYGDKIYIKLLDMDEELIQELKKNDIKFYLDEDYSAGSYVELMSLINLGVTDVYICNDLVYDLDNVREICDKYNVQMRVILNMIPSSAEDAGYDYTSMVWRPQDTPKILGYFDVCEFFVPRRDTMGNDSWDVLFKAFFLNKYWHGDLREINPRLQFDFPNDAVYPTLNDMKYNCQVRCKRRVDNHCDKCSQFMNIAYTLRDKEIRLVSNGD